MNIPLSPINIHLNPWNRIKLPWKSPQTSIDGKNLALAPAGERVKVSCSALCPADRVDFFGYFSWEIHVRRFPKLNHGFGASPSDQYLDLGHAGNGSNEKPWWFWVLSHRGSQKNHIIHEKNGIFHDNPAGYWGTPMTMVAVDGDLLDMAVW